MRGRQTEAQIAGSWVCPECSSPRDRWQRYRFWLLAAFAVPGLLALKSRVGEWSVEYLPHVEGLYFAVLPLAGMLVLLFSKGWINRRCGIGTSAFLWLLVLPLFLIAQIGGAKNDPRRIQTRLELLETHSEQIQAEGGAQISADKLVGWIGQYRHTHRVLEQNANRLGSTRAAVYSYAIDATADLLFGHTNAPDARSGIQIDHRSFWKKLGLNLSPHLVPEFVRCYREADRRGISHRGVLETDKFRSCFGPFGGQP